MKSIVQSLHDLADMGFVVRIEKCINPPGTIMIVQNQQRRMQSLLLLSNWDVMAYGFDAADDKLRLELETLCDDARQALEKNDDAGSVIHHPDVEINFGSLILRPGSKIPGR